MALDIADIGKQAGSRFQLVNAIPATTLVSLVGLLILSGAVGGEPSLETLGRRLGTLDFRIAIVLALFIFSLSLTGNSFQTRLVKILEGYWKPRGVRLWLISWGLERHFARRDRLGIERAEDPDTPISRWNRFWLKRVPQQFRGQLLREYRLEIGSQHDQYPRQPSVAAEPVYQLSLWPDTYPIDTRSAEPDRLMPTRLGNILRRLEDFAGDRYGIDAVSLFPYLLSAASADVVAQYDDARTELDVTVRLVYAWAVAMAISLPLLFDDGPWLVLPAVCFAMSYLSYRGSLLAAESFGSVLVLVVDLHRFDLIEKLRWPLPESLSTEIDQTQPLWSVLSGDASPTAEETAYVHPAATEH